MDLPLLIVATVLTFLVAGAVKGVIGLGLPTVCLAVMTVVADLPTAMALLLVPSFVTNLWQAMVGGFGRTLIRRLWPFFLCATLFIWVGAMFFVDTDLSLLSALLGVLLIVYALIGLLGIRISLRQSQETVLGPVFIQAMGILFTLATVGLAVGLAGNGLVTTELGLLSLAGLIPALAGMVAGQKIRQRLSEAGFRRIFLSSVLVLGLYIGFAAVTQ